MAMYWTCKYGSNHDCGERCDCEEELKKEKERLKKIYIQEPKSNQLTFNFSNA